MKLKIGDYIPSFSLKDQNGSIRSPYKSSKPLVLFFYPKDDTPGCTKEACNFRDSWNIFKKHSIEVLGISKDHSASHRKFIEKYDLPITLLTEHEPCPDATAFESYGLKKFMGREYMGMMRHTFVIDPDGKIEAIYLKVKADNMANQILIDLGLD